MIILQIPWTAQNSEWPICNVVRVAPAFGSPKDATVVCMSLVPTPSSKGSTLAVGFASGVVQLWSVGYPLSVHESDLALSKVAEYIPASASDTGACPVVAMHLLPDGVSLVMALASGTVRVMRLNTQTTTLEPLVDAAVHAGWITGMSVTPLSSSSWLLATASEDATLSFWKLSLCTDGNRTSTLDDTSVKADLVHAETRYFPFTIANGIERLWSAGSSHYFGVTSYGVARLFVTCVDVDVDGKVTAAK